MKQKSAERKYQLNLLLFHPVSSCPLFFTDYYEDQCLLLLTMGAVVERNLNELAGVLHNNFLLKIFNPTSVAFSVEARYHVIIWDIE